MKKIALMSNFLLIILVMACQQKEEQNPFIGKWVYEFSDNEIVLEFKTDGTYALDVNSNDNLPGNLIGVYRIQGEKEVMLKDSIGGGACLGEDQWGKYTYRIEDEKLYMNPIEDKCPGRKKLMMSKTFATRIEVLDKNKKNE